MISSCFYFYDLALRYIDGALSINHPNCWIPLI